MEPRRKRLTLICCLLLAAGTVALYSYVAYLPFVDFDDQYYIVSNEILHAGLTWKAFNWAWVANYQSNWHPLTWLSHALDFQLFGLNPGRHHLTNLLIHVLNVELLFLLLLRATGALGRSLLVAALFACHPLNVESVAWVSERKNVLSTLFFFLTLGAYGWYARSPNVKRYSLLAFFFALGLASKPMVITLPFVLLLLDFWPLKRIAEVAPASTPRRGLENRRRRAESIHESGLSFTPKPFVRLVLEKLPLLLLCVGSAVLTIVAQTKAIGSLEVFPFQGRLANAIYAYAMYIWKAVWPVNLALYYPYVGNVLNLWQLAAASLLIAGVTFLAWKQRFDRRYLIVGWLWYLGTLVPVIGLVQVGGQAIADRYAYITLIGVFVMAVWGVADYADFKSVGPAWRIAISVAILTLLSSLTVRQIRFWRSDYDLWSHAMRVAPSNATAVSNLGDALNRMGRPEEALPLLQQSAKLLPDEPNRHGNLAVDLVQLGRLEEAIPEYETAISLASDTVMQAHFYGSLAAVYAVLGDYAKVRESYRQALAVSPERSAATIQWLTESVSAQPSAPRYAQLGILLQEAGKFSDARVAYQQALKLDPTLTEAKRSLGDLERSK
jgi:tetratricopeptide (TPR) repeat protein